MWQHTMPDTFPDATHDDEAFSSDTTRLMCDLIRQNNPVLGQYAIDYLRRHPDGTKHLLAVLPDALPVLQLAIIAILALRGERRAMPILEALLECPDTSVRKAARAAIEHLYGVTPN